MSNYTKSTNFATKDNLTPGDPLKIVRGTEIDTEYNNIATAIATKTDNASAAITGGTINATTIGATTASTGAFSTLSATGAITSTLATGTAPLVIASTTKVANLNVDSLDGADWASPAALGSTTPAAVSATTLTTSSTVTFNGGTANGVAYLNGSKVVTSGSALTFDGTNLATTGDISLGAGKLLKYSSTAYMTPENNVNGAEISTTGVITFKAGTGASEQMRLTSTGLGIGTSSPAYKLDVRGVLGSGNGTITSGFSYDSGGLVGTFSNHALGVLTNGNVVAKFDSSGNLGLGVTPSAWGSGYKAIEFGNDSAKTGALFSNGTNDTWAVSNTYFNGSNFIYKATGTATGYEQAAGQHRWYNAASGTAGNAITFTQAMTLDTSGNLLAGTTTASNTPSQGITLMQNTSVGSIGIGHANGTTSGNGYMNFAYNGSAIGSITQDGTTAVQFNTTSDQRLKENITDADSASTLIDALQVRKFDWKADGSHQRYGFVAQELVTVAPEAVHQPEDTEQMMAVDYSKLVPMLVKEIQSLRKRLADAGI
jgi:hypothetical protein